MAVEVLIASLDAGKWQTFLQEAGFDIFSVTVKDNRLYSVIFNTLSASDQIKFNDLLEQFGYQIGNVKPMPQK